ncbi:hypothetical protein F5Y15DRAFT_424327 [Xylariaceae sp. FL0016]|nr:hypothetical protein F5Y15DRAFT_424327 [Xylariaceae sp. FL0016]
MKEGLEKTLSQVRQLCGTIERGASGGFSFVKKRDTTVKYVAKHLGTPDYPSIDDLERETFPYLVGWSNFFRQLADNCRAIHVSLATDTKIEWPSWDPACVDVSRFIRQIPASQLIDRPPIAPRHPGHPSEQQALLFHLPKSKAAKIKTMASPDEKRNPRAPPRRMIRNMLAGGFSDLAATSIPPPIAGRDRVRSVTDGVTQASAKATLDYIATLRDQQSGRRDVVRVWVRTVARASVLDGRESHL